MQQVQVKQYIEIVVLMKFKPTQFCYITKIQNPAFRYSKKMSCTYIHNIYAKKILC